MIETLWIIISRSAPATSTPSVNAARIAIRAPNSTNAMRIDRIVKIVRIFRRIRLRQTSGRYFMRPPP